ncbi:MAG: hypothetical protein ACFFBV_00255 [Promethearchaeota archaeon]
MIVRIIALGIIIWDTLLAITRRLYRGLPIPTEDREHIHHKLINTGFSHRRAALVLNSFCVVLSLMAVLLTFSSGVLVGIILAFLGLFIFWGVKGYRILEDP